MKHWPAAAHRSSWFSVEGSAIVRTVVELARTLHMETVAEGIETMQQYASLRALSCDLGQGYHFARLLAAEAVPAAFAVLMGIGMSADDAVWTPSLIPS